MGLLALPHAPPPIDTLVSFPGMATTESTTRFFREDYTLNTRWSVDHWSVFQAWGVIANAPNGAWNEDSEWRQAAIAWRDAWHLTLPNPVEAPDAS